MDFPLYFQKKWFGWGRVYFMAENFSERAKLPQICLSFSGDMLESQIWKVSDNPHNPPPYSEEVFSW